MLFYVVVVLCCFMLFYVVLCCFMLLFYVVVVDHDKIGCKRLAVVKDTNDLSQDRMHLDTFFNVLGILSFVNCWSSMN